MAEFEDMFPLEHIPLWELAPFRRAPLERAPRTAMEVISNQFFRFASNIRNKVGKKFSCYFNSKFTKRYCNSHTVILFLMLIIMCLGVALVNQHRPCKECKDSKVTYRKVNFCAKKHPLEAELHGFIDCMIYESEPSELEQLPETNGTIGKGLKIAGCRGAFCMPKSTKTKLDNSTQPTS